MLQTDCLFIFAHLLKMIRDNITNTYLETINDLPELQRSPWQKHMNTFLELYTVWAHLSSLSSGPLWTHILWIAISKSKQYLNSIKYSLYIFIKPTICTVSSSSFNHLSTPSRCTRNCGETRFIFHFSCIESERIFAAPQFTPWATLKTSS